MICGIKIKLPAAALFAGIAALLLACESGAVDIANILTEDHVRVPGLDLYLKPAPKLSLSKRFNGFDSEERNIEVIVASIKSPYSEIAEGFTDSALRERGVEISSRGDVRINGSEGILMKAVQKDGDKKWGKWILLLEDGENTLVINGAFTSGDSPAAFDVEAMLKSAVIKKDENVLSSADEEISGDIENEEEKRSVEEWN